MTYASNKQKTRSRTSLLGFITGISCALLSQSVSTQTIEYLSVIDFRPQTYTRGFSSGILSSLSVTFYGEKDDDEPIYGQVNCREDPGQTARHFDRSWIEVRENCHTIIEEESTKRLSLYLYDQETKELAHVIDTEDGEVTSYDTSSLPSRIPLDTNVPVGSITIRSKEGEVIGSGTMSWEASKSPVGFDFCTTEIQQLKGSESVTTSIICNIFDKKKRIVAQTMRVKDSEPGISVASGPVKLTHTPK
jgi:hypothetical protein